MDTLDALRALPGKVDALIAAVAALERRLDGLAPAGGEFLSLDEAARLTGLSRRKLQKDVASGELPSVKRGSRRLIPRRRLLAALGAD